MKSQSERQEEARKKKLDEIKEQVDSGGLVIRKMTDAERKQFPKKPPAPKKKRW